MLVLFGSFPKGPKWFPKKVFWGGFRGLSTFSKGGFGLFNLLNLIKNTPNYLLRRCTRNLRVLFLVASRALQVLASFPHSVLKPIVGPTCGTVLPKNVFFFFFFFLRETEGIRFCFKSINVLFWKILGCWMFFFLCVLFGFWVCFGECLRVRLHLKLRGFPCRC